MHGKKLPGIRIIFQKDKEHRNYEKNALLLQDILLYMLTSEMEIIPLEYGT